MCTRCSVFILRLCLSAVDVSFNCYTIFCCSFPQRKNSVLRCTAYKYSMRFNFNTVKENEQMLDMNSVSLFLCILQLVLRFLGLRCMSSRKMCYWHKLCINSSLTSVRECGMHSRKCRFSSVPMQKHPKKYSTQNKMENKLVNNWIEGERERDGKVLPTASCQFCIGVYACNA